MCAPVILPLLTAATTIGSTVAMGNEMRKQREAGQKAMAEQKALAEQQAQQQKDIIASTAKKAKAPNTAEMLYGPKKGDSGSTSLTGPTGVQASPGMLGQNSLLGA